jgi:hypothetical protein
VNVLEGLKLYKGYVDLTEIGKVLSFVNEAKTMRRKPGLEGTALLVPLLYMVIELEMHGHHFSFVLSGFIKLFTLDPLFM